MVRCDMPQYNMWLRKNALWRYASYHAWQVCYMFVQHCSMLSRNLTLHKKYIIWQRKFASVLWKIKRFPVVLCAGGGPYMFGFTVTRHHFLHDSPSGFTHCHSLKSGHNNKSRFFLLFIAHSPNAPAVKACGDASTVYPWCATKKNVVTLHGIWWLVRLKHVNRLSSRRCSTVGCVGTVSHHMRWQAARWQVTCCITTCCFPNFAICWHPVCPGGVITRCCPALPHVVMQTMSEQAHFKRAGAWKKNRSRTIQVHSMFFGCYVSCFHLNLGNDPDLVQKIEKMTWWSHAFLAAEWGNILCQWRSRT